MKTAAHKPTRQLRAVFASALLIALPGMAFAANGLTLTGYGAASAAMGGVDIAVSDDTTALDINPAGLAQLDTPSLDIYVEPYYAINNAHDDAYNTHRRVNNQVGAVGGGGYSHPFDGGDIVAGIGLFEQGGVGYIYRNLNTAFGTRDEVAAVFGLLKLAPGVAWRVNDRLRLGAALGITYALAREKFFPNTSVNGSGTPFFGFRVDGLKGLGFNGKIGLQYQPLPRLTLALAYTSKTRLSLDRGRMTVDYQAIGQGKVTYADARLDGLALPQELGAGATYQITPRLLLAGEFNWMDYSSAVKSLTLSASHPDNSSVPASISSSEPLNFRDVYVFAVAGEFQWSPGLKLRAGFSHANVTIPAQNLSPILALVSGNLLSVGFATELDRHWSLGTALEWQMPSNQTYSNPALPFGPDASESNNAVLLTLMLSRR